MSKAQPHSVTVRLTERQWLDLQWIANVRGKSMAWMAHRLLTYAIPTRPGDSQSAEPARQPGKAAPEQ